MGYVLADTGIYPNFDLGDKLMRPYYETFFR